MIGDLITAAVSFVSQETGRPLIDRHITYRRAGSVRTPSARSMTQVRMTF